MQIPEMSQCSRKVFVLCDFPPLCFLGKPSVWGSRPWSSPTPSPSSSSSSIISWLRGGVLFPYQPPWRPDPRLGWEDLWRSPWWLHLGGLIDCLHSLSPLSPRAPGKEAALHFFSVVSHLGFYPLLSVSQSVRSLVPHRFFSYFLEEKKKNPLLISH